MPLECLSAGLLLTGLPGRIRIKAQLAQFSQLLLVGGGGVMFEYACVSPVCRLT